MSSHFIRKFSSCVALSGLVALMLLSAPAQSEEFYMNPVIPGDHPDPSIIRVGKDFWATATSSEWGPQFPLLHSTDLVNWELKGAVFPHRPEWATANFWAPEISIFKGKYHVYYVGRKSGGPLAVAVATADNPGGPYTDHGPMVAQDAGSIDPVPFEDENGNPYLLWKEDGNSRKLPTPIWAQPMDETGTKLIGEKKELIRNDAKWEGALVEGPFLLKHGDWFYLFYSGAGCCGGGCDYALGVARSRTLLGPWDKNPANPILSGNQNWKCPGHGSIVSDEQGRYWLLYHAYAVSSTVFTGREALLDEVKFGADGWPTINNGSGPSPRAVSPFGAVQKMADLAFADDFSGSTLNAGWQWPQDNEPGCELAGGKLKLEARARPGNNRARAVAARSTTTGDYIATTVIDLSSLKPGVTASITACGDGGNVAGLGVLDKKLVLWRRDRGQFRKLAEEEIPAGDHIHLRITARDGYSYGFSAGADGKDWKMIGEDQTGRQFPPWDRSIRIALMVEAAEPASAEFESFHLQPMAGKGGK